MPLVTGVVVAGGQSQRMGEDKRRLRLWGDEGPTLLEHTLLTLAPLCEELIVVLNDEDGWPNLPARLIPDLYDDAGPLSGIYTGLAAAVNQYALVVAADMPLLNPNLLEAMLKHPRNYDALVPRSPQPDAARNERAIEPLHAVYSQTCVDPLHEALDAGQHRIIDFLAKVRVVTFEPADYRQYDPHGNSFLNINTPEERAAVQQLIDAEQDKC